VGDHRGAVRILGVFAHPDDEAFCAAGTLAKYVEAGAEAMVVSATRGQAGQIRDAHAATRRSLGAVREQELRDACKVLGVQHALCLDYGDGTLADVDRVELQDAVLEQFRGFEPDVVITFGDDGAYGHPDHVAISQATTDAFARARTELARAPGRLYHSHFPRSRLLLVDRLSSWLIELNARFKGTGNFAQALSLLAGESTVMGYADDFVEVAWYPPGIYIVEQGEPATSLYLLLSGTVEVVSEAEDGTMTPLTTLGAGEFFGEVGVARQAARSAHVISLEAVTCLTLSPAAPAAFAGRGSKAQFVGGSGRSTTGGMGGQEFTTAIDVGDSVDRKVAAIAAHRTQFPIDPSMFPMPILQEMFGTEYFVRVWPPVEPETGITG
jgi:LmbE family N-acetylglucosaminyl deacetylase